MGHRVRISFFNAERTTIHRVRNFGEDLYRRFRDEKRIAIDIDEIDRATDEISYVVHNGQLRRSIQETKRLLADHRMSLEVTITTGPT